VSPSPHRPDAAAPPPRIAPLTADELGPEAAEIVGQMRRALGLPEGGEIPQSAAILVRRADLYGSYAHTARLLMRGALAPRDRELAILRGAWICQAPFEWGEHVVIGKRAGLTRDEVERVTQGSAAPGWSDHERAVLRAAEELHASANLTDETWGLLARSLDEGQLIELVVLIGQYASTAFVQNALRIPLRPDNPGLSAR
jgi:alkylhydroperoxidase family enzyme